MLRQYGRCMKVVCNLTWFQDTVVGTDVNDPKPFRVWEIQSGSYRTQPSLLYLGYLRTGIVFKICTFSTYQNHVCAISSPVMTEYSFSQCTLLVRTLTSWESTVNLSVTRKEHSVQNPALQEQKEMVRIERIRHTSILRPEPFDLLVALWPSLMSFLKCSYGIIYQQSQPILCSWWRSWKVLASENLSP